MKKVVVKLEVYNEKGVNSISMDMKEKKLTVTGDVDPVNLVSKLRKVCVTDIVSVGPEKEEKKEQPKKEEPKKGEEKKKEDQVAELLKAYKTYNPYLTTPYYYVRSVEEDPNGCVIC